MNIKERLSNKLRALFTDTAVLDFEYTNQEELDLLLRHGVNIKERLRSVDLEWVWNTLEAYHVPNKEARDTEVYRSIAIVDAMYKSIDEMKKKEEIV